MNYQISVLLEKSVFCSVAAVGVLIVKVLFAIKLDNDIFIDTQKINFHFAAFIKGNREVGIDLK